MDYIIMGMGIAVGLYILPVVVGLVAIVLMGIASVVTSIFR
jgi:uncharacterized membrane protein